MHGFPSQARTTSKLVRDRFHCFLGENPRAEAEKLTFMYEDLKAHYQKHKIDYQRVTGVQPSPHAQAAALQIQSPIDNDTIGNDETQSRKNTDSASKPREQT